MPDLYYWYITITDRNGNTRELGLDHEYATEDEAAREAEDLAGWEFTEYDEDWGLLRGNKVQGTDECPGCHVEISLSDKSEQTTLADHGVCWYCNRQIVNGERCPICLELGHRLSECPMIDETFEV